MEAGFL